MVLIKNSVGVGGGGVKFEIMLTKLLQHICFYMQ